MSFIQAERLDLLPTAHIKDASVADSPCNTSARESESGRSLRSSHLSPNGGIQTSARGKLFNPIWF